MLSHLDCIIFPDRCEVIEVVPSQRYVYPIFKNGQSSLNDYSGKNKCKILLNEQIQILNNIDVILRDPKQRFQSGINTFIQMTLRDHPTLDIHTITWFATNYLFLNRHYAPQFLWLLNLARYLNPNATLNFLAMDQLGSITNTDKKPLDVKPISKQLADQQENLLNNEMYDRIDRALILCIGQKLTFDQLIRQIKQQDHIAYDWVIGRSQRILKPTYVLSQT